MIRVAGSILLWFLPDAWFQVHLLAPDAEERMAERLRQRFGAGQIPDELLEELIASEVMVARQAAADGVILLATYSEGEPGPAQIPAGLSLTLAVAQLPTTSLGETPVAGTGASAGFASSVAPLALGDREVKAFSRETRSEVDISPLRTDTARWPGRDARTTQFQGQAFVVPADETVTAVVTVTTFSTDWEDRARKVARTFADTLVFVSPPGEQ